MRFIPATLAVILGLLCISSNEARAQNTTPIRAGMIGLDTSHVPAFAKLFNGPKAVGDLAGIKIVAAYPGGTDFGPSKTRVAKFTEDIRGM